MAANIVHVDLEHAATTLILPAAISVAAGPYQPTPQKQTLLVIADATVSKFHGETVMESLRQADLDPVLTTFAPGEANKNISTCEQLWQACADASIDRSCAVIALGGGVTGDMAGYVSATWMRGVQFIQIPTTLLSMVDSSVGGKTGVNSAAGKNLIGSFQQPACVVIDPDVVTTMDQREYRSGLAEVIKYGVINDPEFLAWQEANVAALVSGDSAASHMRSAKAVASKPTTWKMMSVNKACVPTLITDTPLVTRLNAKPSTNSTFTEKRSASV